MLSRSIEAAKGNRSCLTDNWGRENLWPLGPNGAGKSTLINAILGLIPLNAGEVTVLQQSYKSIRKISSKIGYVPQDIAVYPDLTAYENVELFGSLYGLKGNKLKEQVLKSLSS